MVRMTAETLLQWRKARGLSQTEMASALGCSRRSIVNWEAGAHEVPKYIALACAALAKKLRLDG